MLRLVDFVAMNEQTRAQSAEKSLQPIANPLQLTSNALSYEQVTQKLIDNIAKRHAGHIQLRALAPK